MESPIAQTESPYEVLRRLENVVRLGTIAAVRHNAPARCRVRTGGLTTDWVPWVAPRAGGQGGNVWWPPVVGEQCMLLAPGGDLLNAVAIVGIYSDANPQGSESPHIALTEWGGGDYMKHNAEAKTLEIVTQFGILLRVMSTVMEMTENKVHIHAGGSSITVEPGRVAIQGGGGTLVVDGGGATGAPDVKANGISLTGHTHSGVTPGSGESGPPVGAGTTGGPQ